MLKTKMKELRLKERLTQEEMASSLKVSRATYTRYETGDRIPDYTTIKKIADIFRVPMDYLCDDNIQGAMQELKNIGFEVYKRTLQAMVPIYGTVKAGYGSLAIEDFYGYEPVDADMLAGGVENYFWLKVKGDSMSPFIEAGDYVLVRRQSEAENGQIVIAMLDGEEGTVKKLHKQQDFIELIPINQAYSVQRFECGQADQLKIIGIVKEIKRKLKL